MSESTTAGEGYAQKNTLYQLVPPGFFVHVASSQICFTIGFVKVALIVASLSVTTGDPFYESC